MDELVQFLRARLDEGVARAAVWHDLECEIHARMNTGLLAAIAAGQMFSEVPGAVCDCGGPARALRDIEAKRRALDDLLPDLQHADQLIEGEWGHSENVAERMLHLLASAYTDHPSYREEWRP